MGQKEQAAALVPRELVEDTSSVGDVGFEKDRIAAYEESGATILNVQPIGPIGTKDVETVAGWL